LNTLRILTRLFTIVIVAALSISPFLMESRVVHLIFLCFIYIILAQSMNIASIAGAVNLGVHGMFGLGAYIFALALPYNIPFPISLLLSGFGSVVFLLPFLLLLKLRGAYLAIATLTLPLLISSVILLMPEQTGGARGLFVPSVPEPHLTSYYVALVAVLILQLALDRLFRSKYKYALDAIFDDVEVASSLGIPVFKYRCLFFSISVFFASFAGGILTLTLRYIDVATVFNTDDLGIATAAMIFGGVRTVWGPLIGAVLFTVVVEQLRASFMYIHTAILGLLMILLVLFMRGGLLNTISVLRSKIKHMKVKT